jgi:L-malate glycosyltransferase
MRLAFVSTIGYPWGGSEALWTATAREALVQGHAVMVSVFDWPKQDPRVDDLKQLGAVFHYRRRFFPAPPDRIKKKVFNYLLHAGRKRTYHDYLLDFKPDLIFFNLAGGDEIASSDDDLMVFIRQSAIPFVVAFHSLSDRPRFTERTIENYIFHTAKAKANLFTSELQRRLLEHQIASEIPRARIVCHPLNTGDQAPTPFPSMMGKVQFAAVGSLVCRWKGQDLIIKILSGKDWQDRNWQLNLYGEGEDLSYLRRLVKFYGIEERIRFHGNEKNISRIWEQNHMLLAPSRQDSGPIVCFEAMYFARPVVGSRMGAMPEYIRQRETGVLAAGIGETDFANALEIAWEHRDQWKIWGEKGREYLQERYDFQPGKTLLRLLSAQD